MIVNTMRQGESISLKEAIAASLKGGGYDCPGQLEATAQTADNSIKALAHLTSLLVDKGVFTEREIAEKILDYRFRYEEAE